MKHLEAGLDTFIQGTGDQSDNLQATEGLKEIETMIKQAEIAPKEIYDSKEAAEVAKENEQALAALNESFKPVRKRKRR